MKLCGACSLKRKSSPGCNALKGAAPGDQKLTSVRSGCTRRRSNHSRSVTATMSWTAMISSCRTMVPQRLQVGTITEFYLNLDIQPARTEPKSLAGISHCTALLGRRGTQLPRGATSTGAIEAYEAVRWP